MEPSFKKPFPILSNHKAFEIHGILTDIICLSFSNKIFVIVSQVSKIGSLIQSTIDDYVLSLPDYEHVSKDSPDTSKDLLTFKFEKHTVSSKYILGNLQGTASSSIYEIIASQIMNQIVEDNPTEKRALLIGIALKRELLSEGDLSLGSFGKLSETLKCLAYLTSKCRVW
ncbi:hypothetical protein DSO57_1004925 [Entomophthora muscae]|uniref:Uncharacterized protein n=1 Tax=Entomophthora muscae TaxID=34485 RepID=A0ACC2SL31_9FUNG|nr:hypothetical protein DSO57_1004925 [Entomophthora muscae]